MSDKITVSSSDFELVSGLEIHVQLNTNTKIFSSESAAFGAKPNQHISPVSLALPGALPKLNKQVVEKAIRMGLALNCKINQVNYFDRKNYFYADLPKGYQITQDNNPICQDGFINVKLSNGTEKRISINRIHLEEDAGKSLHDQDERFSCIDLNRAGVPLIEIVTEPDIRSAEEASALLTEIRKLVRHLNVSDGNMEEGSLRCDANISIRPKGSADYGIRCEVKNLNSIRNVRRAMDFEFARQREVIAKGGVIIQSTLNFDSDQGTTSPMRNKEEANDYRYFPDPDLVPLHISDERLAQIRAEMPELPAVILKRLMTDYNLGLSEAAVLGDDSDLFHYFTSGLQNIQQPKSLINWLTGPIRAFLSDNKLTIASFTLSPHKLSEVINLVDEKRISHQVALQRLIPDLLNRPESDVLQLSTELNLLIKDNADELYQFVEQVLAKFQPQVQAYKNGKKGVLGLFVGEVMKLAEGKADPKMINNVLLQKLNS